MGAGKPSAAFVRPARAVLVPLIWQHNGSPSITNPIFKKPANKPPVLPVNTSPGAGAVRSLTASNFYKKIKWTTAVYSEVFGRVSVLAFITIHTHLSSVGLLAAHWGAWMRGVSGAGDRKASRDVWSLPLSTLKSTTNARHQMCALPCSLAFGLVRLGLIFKSRLSYPSDLCSVQLGEKGLPASENDALPCDEQGAETMGGKASAKL